MPAPCVGSNGAAVADFDTTPVKAKLFCPRCHKQHVDEPPWDVVPYTAHICTHCDGVFNVEHPRCCGVLDPGGAPVAASGPFTAKMRSDLESLARFLDLQKADPSRRRRNLALSHCVALRTLLSRHDELVAEVDHHRHLVGEVCSALVTADERRVALSDSHRGSVWREGVNDAGAAIFEAMKAPR